MIPHRSNAFKVSGKFKLDWVVLASRSVQQFPIQLTTTQLLIKVFKSQIRSSSLTVRSPQQHDAVSIHRSNTTISRF